MIRTSEQMVSEIKESLRGGKGSVTITNLLVPGEFKGKARLIARITIEPGCSIGYHIHENEEEIYYILSGVAEYDDNGTVCRLAAGDVSVTLGGEFHGIANPGSEKLELLATILLY